ncbi:MAG: ribosome recycling factor [Bacteroidota bacterium]
MFDENIELILEDAKDHMEKSIDHLRAELNTLRAGRATPAMLEGVRVDYYGSQTPLNQMANVNAPQPDLLVVQPWDRSSLPLIERAIMEANLGLNPSNDGSLIRIPVPAPTEERRRELVKTARARGEDAKVSIRNVRRHAKDDIKSTQQELSLSEDERYGAEDNLQKLTDAYVKKVDQVLDRKEEDIMAV